MDDVFGMLPSWMFTAIVAVVVLVIIGIIFARLYRRASAEQAFVRTGLGGQKVVMSGGAIAGTANAVTRGFTCANRR